MALDRFDNDFEHTVYGKVKNMTIDEFAEFLFCFYDKAWHDGRNSEDDEVWVKRVYPYCVNLFPWEDDEYKRVESKKEE